MLKKYWYLIVPSVILVGCSGCSDSKEENTPSKEVESELTLSQSSLSFDAETGEKTFVVKANKGWDVLSSVDWVNLSPSKGGNGETSVKVTVDENDTEQERETNIQVRVQDLVRDLTIRQGKGFVPDYVPKGYQLVWNDEFNETALADGKHPLPNSDWWFETGNQGWGNNEPQNYVDKVAGNDTVAQIKNGKLYITAHKLETPYEGSDYISARMNTSQSWLYGYFEMKAKLPGGKGTWAAFWMMPKNYKEWPLDGEIDILEYVGYRPDVVQTSIHTEAYNHKINTEKTATQGIQGAETKYHVYGLKWTEDEIIGYVDGIEYFSFKNDKKNDKKTWPFNQLFYIKLNLAIGGDWGGLHGIDDTIFPVDYIIDYVRVYQKQQ